MYVYLLPIVSTVVTKFYITSGTGNTTIFLHLTVDKTPKLLFYGTLHIRGQKKL